MVDTIGVEHLFWDAQTDTTLIPRFLRSAVETHHQTMRSEEWFRWKFAQSPWGSAIVCFGLAGDGRIAGNVSFGWHRLQYNNTYFNAAIAYESFVHPDFQRRGLYTRLLKMAKARAVAEGADFFVMLPNSASRRAIQKSGLHDVGGTFQLIKILKPLRMVKQTLKDGKINRTFSPGNAKDRSQNFRKKLEFLLQNSGSYSWPDIIHSVHDPDYIYWRFADKPRFHYEVVGTPSLWSIFRLGTRFGLREAQIMGVYGNNKCTRKTLYTLLNEISKGWHVDLISYFCTKGNPLRNMLYLNGFLPVPTQSNFYVEWCGAKPPSVDFLNPLHWGLFTADLHTH